jgi:flagellar export protein FliJ
MESSRLEVVRWWRSQLEKTARRSYAEASAKEEAARSEEQRLREAMLKDSRKAADAAFWELGDLSVTASERKLKDAKEVTKKAAEVADVRRQSHIAAARGLKSVENVVAGKLAEERSELDRKERKEADEHALNRFARKVA